jgi:hypothetical protein
VFEGCDLKGPVMLVPQGSNFTNSSLVGDPDALLWEIPSDRPEVIGTVLVPNCTFEGCTFLKGGIRETTRIRTASVAKSRIALTVSSPSEQAFAPCS